MSEVWTATQAAALLRVPAADDDKYSRGVVGLRTGSEMYPGAAVLSVEGAWRAGAGLVRWVGEDSVADLVLARRPETVRRNGRAGAWVIGSGIDADDLGKGESSTFAHLLKGDDPVIVDAGALSLVGDHTAPVLVTPHAREFARLAERLGVDLTGDRDADAIAVAAAATCTVLLKGSTTVVADADGHVVHVDAGTGWLATAGTGDVLAGVIGAIVTQNPHAGLLAGAATGAYLHGVAGRIASRADEDGGGVPITALDVAGALPEAIARTRGLG